MPKRAPYPLGFRQQMVELVRAGRTPEALAREFVPLASQFSQSCRFPQTYVLCSCSVHRNRCVLSGAAQSDMLVCKAD